MKLAIVSGILGDSAPNDAAFASGVQWNYPLAFARYFGVQRAGAHDNGQH
jgi:hypothetical protein